MPTHRPSATASVRFLPLGREIQVPEGTTVLEAARHAGVPLGRACGGDGICGRCAVRVLGGAGWLEPAAATEREVLRRNRLPQRLRLACRLRVRGAIAVAVGLGELSADGERRPAAAARPRAVAAGGGRSL